MDIRLREPEISIPKNINPIMINKERIAAIGRLPVMRKEIPKTKTGIK